MYINGGQNILRSLGIHLQFRMKVLLVILGLVAFSMAAPLNVNVNRHCGKELYGAGLTKNYYENIGHAVHSMSVQVSRIIL